MSCRCNWRILLSLPSLWWFMTGSADQSRLNSQTGVFAAKMQWQPPDSHDSAVSSPSQVAPKLEEALKLYKDWGRGLLPTDFFCE